MPPALLSGPGAHARGKDVAQARVYTRAIRGDYVVVPPHIYIRELMLAVINQRSLRLRILIGAFVPKAPDTLYPIGNSITHIEWAEAHINIRVEPGPFRGPFTKNPFSL